VPESDLATLLATLAPARIEGEYVFASVTDAQFGALSAEDVLGSFREPEGLSVLVPKSVARQQGFAHDCVFAGITLGVYSSLQAVGLTAAVASALAARGIPANVIAACRHDHVFVPVAQLATALEILHSLTGEVRA
jgi:hypothetical protein